MKFRITGAAAAAMLLLLLVSAGAICGSGPAGMPPTAAEERAVYETARAYLDAEVRRDIRAVYDYLAPSSVYCATHDYAAYAAEAEASPVRILAYRILRVDRIRDNEDRKNFPRVERFAQVEVELQFFYADTGQTAEVNFDFTFIREEGRWYKG